MRLLEGCAELLLGLASLQDGEPKHKILMGLGDLFYYTYLGTRREYYHE